MSVESYINWSQLSHAQFAAMSLRDQIIFFALAVAITVLALTITYWAVKGSLYLTYYAVKLSLYITYYSVVLSLLFPYIIIKLLISPNQSRPIQPKMPVSQTVAISVEESHRFCSQCGKKFTSTMEEAIHNNGNCFCESCGGKAEIRA
ncbi:hypothetical protein [Candidatus Lokiarchaeum ossiferum]|uniref:hypothetical protein n=1 Tax=Candidatus Lokiarchaeum ossiferum TaxID=2951803 RepID=UPI00352E9A45